MNFKELSKFTEACFQSSDKLNFSLLIHINRERLDPYSFLIQTFTQAKNLFIKNKKHQLNKSVNGDWHQQSEEIKTETAQNIAMILRTLSNTHQYQIEIFKLLYISYCLDKCDSEEVPTSYAKLLSAIMHDTCIISHEEKENLKLFNAVRNMFIHTPTDIVTLRLTDELIAQMIKLSETVSQTNERVIQTHKEKIGTALSIKIKSYTMLQKAS